MWIQFIRILLVAALLLPATARAESDKALQQSLHHFFAQGVHWQDADAELIKVEQWPPVRGAVRWHLPRLHGHPKRIALIAEQGQGKHIKRWYVPVRVHWWSKVVVTQHSLSARTLLNKSMIKQARSDIAGHHGHIWKSVSDLAGMRLTRPLAAGAVILSNHVKRPPLIRRGDPVQIVLDAGPIHIRTAGKALRTVSRGERLLVRNVRSHEVIQAIAESSRTVRVAMDGAQG